MAQGRSTKIVSMIEWIRTSRLSIKSSLSGGAGPAGRGALSYSHYHIRAYTYIYVHTHIHTRKTRMYTVYIRIDRLRVGWLDGFWEGFARAEDARGTPAQRQTRDTCPESDITEYTLAYQNHIRICTGQQPKPLKSKVACRGWRCWRFRATWKRFPIIYVPLRAYTNPHVYIRVNTNIYRKYINIYREYTMCVRTYTSQQP